MRQREGQSVRDQLLGKLLSDVARCLSQVTKLSGTRLIFKVPQSPQRHLQVLSCVGLETNWSAFRSPSPEL